MPFLQNLSISISLILEEILNSPACKAYELICSLTFLYTIVHILIVCAICFLVSCFFPFMLKSRILRIYMYTIPFIMALNVPIQICGAIASVHMFIDGIRGDFPYFIDIVRHIAMALLFGCFIGPSKAEINSDLLSNSDDKNLN